MPLVVVGAGLNPTPDVPSFTLKILKFVGAVVLTPPDAVVAPTTAAAAAMTAATSRSVVCEPRITR